MNILLALIFPVAVMGIIAWYLDIALRGVKELKAENVALTKRIDMLTRAVNNLSEEYFDDNPIREAEDFVGEWNGRLGN